MQNLKEFEASYSYDENDLESMGLGSGVHLDKDVILNFNFTDRTRSTIRNETQAIRNKYFKSIVFDIADEGGNIVYPNYQSGYSTSLSISEKQNELIFGKYKKDFSIYFKVEDNTTDIISSGKFDLYGNMLNISSVKSYDSFGEMVFNETHGPYMKVSFNEGEVVFSGKMILEDSDFPGSPNKFFLSGVKNHPEMPVGMQDHEWIAHLTWAFDYPSENINLSDEEKLNKKGGWTMTFEDFSPSGYFLINTLNTEKSNPYGVFDDHENKASLLKFGTQPKNNSEGIKNEDSLALEIKYQNLSQFTKREGLDISLYKGEELKENEFSYKKTVDGKHCTKIILDSSMGVTPNEKTWVRLTPRSPFGLGKDWIIGPLIHKEDKKEEETTNVSQISFGDRGGSANVNFKKGTLGCIIEDGSGVIDRILANKEHTGEHHIFECNSGIDFEYTTVPTDENGIWLRSFFNYSLQMSSVDDDYDIISKTIKLSTTGKALSGINEGLPLFKIEGSEDIGEECFNITPKYSESGVSLLVNLDQKYKNYKFYKTSF